MEGEIELVPILFDGIAEDLLLGEVAEEAAISGADIALESDALAGALEDADFLNEGEPLLGTRTVATRNPVLKFMQTAGGMATAGMAGGIIPYFLAPNKSAAAQWNTKITDNLTAINARINDLDASYWDNYVQGGGIWNNEEELKSLRSRLANDKAANNVLIAKQQAKMGYDATDASTQKSVDVFGTVGYTTTEQKTNTILLNPIIQGSNFFNRIGTYVKLQSISLKAAITPISESLSSFALLFQNDIRTLIVYDKQYNYQSGTNQPVFSDVCQDFANDGTLSSTSRANYNPANQERFEIVYDNYLNLSTLTQVISGGVATAVAQPNVVTTSALTLNKEIILNKPCYFQTTSNTAGDKITTGALWLILKSDVETPSGGTVVPWTVLNYSIRTFFTDNDTPNNDFTKRTHKRTFESV